jgi:hypothetical protein
LPTIVTTGVSARSSASEVAVVGGADAGAAGGAERRDAGMTQA